LRAHTYNGSEAARRAVRPRAPRSRHTHVHTGHSTRTHGRNNTHPIEQQSPPTTRTVSIPSTSHLIGVHAMRDATARAGEHRASTEPDRSVATGRHPHRPQGHGQRTLQTQTTNGAPSCTSVARASGRCSRLCVAQRRRGVWLSHLRPCIKCSSAGKPVLRGRSGAQHEPVWSIASMAPHAAGRSGRGGAGGGRVLMRR